MKTSVNVVKFTDQKIVEVKTVRTDEDANKLLSEGWVLLNSGTSHIDAQGYNAKPHFIVGRVKR